MEVEKVIETDNLIHKFNTYIVEILTNKSIHSPQKEYLLIRKKKRQNLSNSKMN